MEQRIVPKQYLLTPKDRSILQAFLNGEIGVREAGKRMNTNHQNIPRIITSLVRQAASSKRIDVTKLFSKK